MIYKKLFLCLAGLITLLTIGANIFLYQKVNELSDKLALNEDAKEESISPSIFDHVEQSPEKVAKNSNIYDINELKYQLKAAEEEIDLVNERLAEVLEKNNMEAKPEQNSKAAMVNNIKRHIDRDYALLYRRLDLSPEDLNEFKRIVLEWRLANQERRTLLSTAFTPEDREKAGRLGQENRDKYNSEFIDLMGEDKFLIYDGLKNSGSERNEFNRLAANVPPENRISDDNAEELIYGMYMVRKSIKNEINLDGFQNSSYSNEIKYLRMIEMEIQVNEKYEEVISNILPQDQAELFNAQLIKQREKNEDNKKMVLLALENKKDKEDISVISD